MPILPITLKSALKDLYNLYPVHLVYKLELGVYLRENVQLPAAVTRLGTPWEPERSAHLEQITNNARNCDRRPLRWDRAARAGPDGAPGGVRGRFGLYRFGYGRRLFICGGPGK